MLRKLCLLAVVCLSLVGVRGDQGLERAMNKILRLITAKYAKENSQKFVEVLKSRISRLDNTSDEHLEASLEEAIKEGISIATDLNTVTLKVLNREWNTWNDVRREMARNASAYTKKTAEDMYIFQNKLRSTAEEINGKLSRSWEHRDKMSALITCMEKVQVRAYNKVEDRMKKFTAKILQLNFDFNTSAPAFPFELAEEQLRNIHSEYLDLIKSSNNTESVATVVGNYYKQMNEIHTSYMSTTEYVNYFLFKYNVEVYEYYRDAIEETNNILFRSGEDLKKCQKNQISSEQKLPVNSDVWY